MIKDLEKIEKAKLIIQKIADGTNPINGQPIENDSFCMIQGLSGASISFQMYWKHL